MVSIGAMTLAAFLFFVWPMVAGRVARHVPETWLEPMAEQALALLVGNAKECTGPKGRAELEAMLASLANASGYASPIQLRVVERKSANAFALPGGRIVLFSPVIEKAESADEVAGVLSHEIGHLMKGHAREAIVRHIGAQLVLRMMTGADSSMTGVMLLEHLNEMSHSRKAEREADQLGLAMMQRAGYDPKGLSHFLNRIAKKEGG